MTSNFDFALGETADMIRDTTERFATDRIAPIAAKVDAEDWFPQSLWPEMGALGLHGVTVAEEDGGLGESGAEGEILTREPDLAARFAVLVSIPGIGEVTAIAMLIDMPELGTLDSKQVASLAGLAPIARDSGQHRGKRHIRGGRAQLRQALYMPALVATRFNPDMKAKYTTLVAAGKPPKVAITAIIRKLVILANALLKEGRNWSPKPA